MANRNKRGGVVGDLISGTGALIVVTIVILVITSTLLGANLLRSTAVSDSASDSNISLNTTSEYILTQYSALNRSFGISTVIHSNDSTTAFTGYTFDANNGSIIGTANGEYDVNINYSWFSPTKEEDTADNMGGNLSKGIDNVSEKIPTILLIAAVVLLFGVIVLLVKQSQAMGIGGQGGTL